MSNWLCFNTEEWEALVKVSFTERRDPRDQAAHIVCEWLKANGWLEISEPIQTVTHPVASHVIPGITTVSQNTDNDDPWWIPGNVCQQPNSDTSKS